LVLPNFLIIGAARSGTTSLYDCLRSHPDVYLPQEKRPEPHFFYKSGEFARGLAYYEQRYFGGWQGECAVGEASTSYLFGADVPERVHATLPGVRLICLLRNPIDRAFSSYWHTVAGGLETLTFEDALVAEEQRHADLAGTPLGEVAPFAYVARGRYFEQLNRWLRFFPRERFKIVLFDDFVARPGQAVADVLAFLAVDPALLPARAVAHANRSVPDSAAMSTSVRRLLADQFRSDVSHLQTLLGRDLQHWLTINE
jgi:hypothetical protein